MKQDIITKSVEAPAELLEKTIETTQGIGRELRAGPTIQKTKDYWRLLGPGLTTGAADDDPSGIATYSQTGAQYGFHLLWLAGLTFPLMAVVQEMCARIGIVTGRGLASNIRTLLSQRALYACSLLLFAANTFNIGADLGAMVQGVQLVFPNWNFTLLIVGLTGFMLGLQIFTPYARYAKYLKWLAMVLFAYVLSTILAHVQWSEVLKAAVVPHISFNKSQLLLICGILGTTISPYLFFWQTSQEVEDEITQGNTTIALRQHAAGRQVIKRMRIDVWSGMFLSNLIMFFIIAACGALLFTHNVTDIKTSAQAAEALRPFAGSATYFLFAVGIIGTGLLAIPVLAGASSYAIAESLHQPGSLHKKLKQAYAFYGVIIISMVVGLGMNFIGLNPIKALIWSAILNGLVAPVILTFILLISNNRRIMGEQVNGSWARVLGWITVGLMTLSGIGAILSLL